MFRMRIDRGKLMEKRLWIKKTLTSKRAERRDIMKANHKIKVEMFFGPIGNCGFRTGDWTVMIDGVKHTMYASVPHSISIEEQEDILTEKAKRVFNLK